MLYDCWREIARAHPDETALRDVTLARQWTFRELAAETERSKIDETAVAFPEGSSADFILSVLRAWRDGTVVCPVEVGQPHPECSGSLPANIVHLKTTSATTGSAQLVAFTAEQLAADADNVVTTMGMRAEWPNLGVISLAHSYGFSNLVLPLLLHGVPLILAGVPLPEIVRRAAASEKNFTLPAVPALWRTWHSADAIPSNVALAISAGAPLPLNLERDIFERHRLKIHNFYGASECGGIAYDSSDSPRVDGSCVGAPMRNVQLSVAEDGCLEVRSRAVGQTYLAQANSNLKDGVFHTNDLAEVLNGFVFLRGRIGDQINIAGRKVSPEGIEKILATHPAVSDCLVFGVASGDNERGEQIVAYIVSASTLTGETLKQFLLERIPAWQVPRDWRFVESLEANRRGKRSRADWRMKYLTRDAS
jgi:long-chain acyl-CoA synthetase